MYSLNSLHRATLITALEVIQRANSNHTLDSAKLDTAIEIAEARFVLPLLGPTMFNEMVAAKNITATADNLATLQGELDQQIGQSEPYELQIGEIVNSEAYLPANYRDLWKNGLYKLTAEAVMIVALPDNYAQFTSQGLVKNNPAVPVIGGEDVKSVGATLADLKFLMDQAIQGRYEPLRVALHGYICRNRVNYATYPHNCDDCLGTNRVNGTGGTPMYNSWATGIYDDDYTNGRNCC